MSTVPPCTSVDYVLRTVQQHHVQLSVMADTKASILITISSIVLTIALKYRFLRFAYVALLAGFIAATVVEIYVIWG